MTTNLIDVIRRYYETSNSDPRHATRDDIRAACMDARPDQTEFVSLANAWLESEDDTDLSPRLRDALAVVDRAHARVDGARKIADEAQVLMIPTREFFEVDVEELVLRLRKIANECAWCAVRCLNPDDTHDDGQVLRARLVAAAAAEMDAAFLFVTNP